MTLSPSSAEPIDLDLGGEKVGGLLLRPEPARALFLFAHGAGAGMKHAFMEKASVALAGHGIATLRYQFPFMAAGRRRPDPSPVLLETVRAAAAEGRRLMPGVPLLAGGKSLGGRSTSMAQAEEGLPGVRGIVFFGFPLHPAGKPGIMRAQHLVLVDPPMLFLQGGRDRLADVKLLRALVEDQLGRGATLHLVPDADHSFHVPKKGARSDDQVIEDLAAVVARWAEPLLAGDG